MTAAVCSVSCGKVLGLDEYSTGATVGPNCPDLEAPSAAGSCESAGVDKCGEGFVSDRRGGCTPVVPPGDCASEAGGAQAAWPGKGACAALTLCNDQWPQSRIDFKPTKYVKSDAAPGGDGSQDRPFKTIAEAYAAGGAEILVGSGTLSENVVVNRPVAIHGNCAEQTILEGLDAEQPVLTFEAGSDGSQLYGMEVRKGKDGVVIRGAGGVDIGGVRIDDVDRSGIWIEDSPPEYPQHIWSILVDHAGERGIEVWGGEAKIEGVMITAVGTPGVSPSIGSVGIAVHPSRYVPWVEGVWSPPLATPSTVTLAGALIQGMQQGLLVEGSSVDASRVAIRDTDRGVVARFRPEGGVPATLTLNKSSVERSRLVGVDIWNATTTLDGVTVRSSEATCPPNEAGGLPGSFLGNGVRARYDRNVTEDQPRPPRTATLKHSLIVGAAQAGVHMEGGSLLLDHTIVRDTTTEACSASFGDGVVAYSYEFSPADVRIVASRIAGSHRAAVATFDAPVTLQGSELDCNERDLVRAGSTIDIDGSPSCGCHGSVRACATENEPKLEASVVKADCGSGLAASCNTMCFEDIFVPGTLVTGATVGALRYERIAPTITDEFGCATVGGLEPGRLTDLTIFGDKYTAAVAYSIADSGQSVRPRMFIPALSNGAQGDTQKVLGFWPGYPSSTLQRLDLSGSIGVGIFACSRPATAVTGGPVTLRQACGRTPSDPNNMTGIPGMTIDLVPKPKNLPLAGPTYSNGGASPLGGSKTAEGGFSFYLNVPPGDYDVVLHPPEGQRLTCTPDLVSDHVAGALEGTPSGDGLHYKFRSEPGYIVGAAFVYCEALP